MYCVMLEKYVLLQLDDIEMEEEDGVPPHYSLRVREALDNCIGGRWIDRERPTPLPPRSTDLIP